MEIIIGSGDYLISGCEKDGKEGVLISLLKNHGHEIDTNADKMINESTPHCIILFNGLKAARLFQDQVNTACLRMNGYEIINKTE